MKIGTFLGVAAAGLGLFLLVKSKVGGGNGGNGGDGGGSFTFGTPTAQAANFPPPLGWLALIFDCSVTNNESSPVQRNLEIWYTEKIDYSGVPGYPPGSVYISDPKPIYQPGYSALAVSLSPGESLDYHYSGLDHAEGPVFLMGTGGVVWTFWLQDDLGNKSPEVVIQT